MKKFLSSILAVVMVLSSMAMVVSANETEQTTGIWVGTTSYTSLDAAAAAAAQTTSKEITIVGTVEVASRQTIAYEGIVIEGHDGATIAASDSFKNSSETNRKAVLTIAANNVKVNNLTVDGTKYDSTLATANSYDFNVVRINSGTGVELNNVTVKGSKRTLISVGTETTAVADVNVTATNLICEATVKTLPYEALFGAINVYADVNVKNAKFTLISGQVDGFICLDDECSGEIENKTTDHYTLLKDSDDETSSITSTFEHYMASYINSESTTNLFAPSYSSVFSYSTNLTTVGNMVTEADSHTNTTYVEAFVRLLTAAKEKADTTTAATLETYISTLTD